MKTVLLIDDNPDILELVQLVLASTGYKLLTAEDGNAAVEICTKDSPDLVLMDLNMPKMNGFEATRELRRRGFDRPIIILTASESERDRKKAMEAGCTAYLLKTLEMRDVQQLLDHHLMDIGGLE